MASEHRIEWGPEWIVTSEQRGYLVRCACGWESGLCRTMVLAEAAGEQHVTLSGAREPR